LLPEDKLFWQNMGLEEYRSIRSESEQARNAQQTILQWSLTSFAAIIAGGLVDSSARHKRLGRAKYMIGYVGASGIYFGFSVAALAVFATLVANHDYQTSRWTGLLRDPSWAWCGIFLLLFLVVALSLTVSADRPSRQGVLITDTLPPLSFASRIEETSTAPALSSEEAPSGPTALPQEGG